MASRPGPDGAVTEVPRVAFVTAHVLRGGAEAYLARLLDELGPAWRAGVIALQDGPGVARLPEPVVLPTSASRVAMARSAWRLRRVLRAMRPDVVHADGVKAAVVAAAALVGSRTPLVWVKHDFSYDGRLVRIVARRCAEVVGVSSAVLAAVPGRVPTSVVPPGIELPPVDRGPSRGVVALVARFHSVKGHFELLAAVPEVLRHCPDARFLFVGGDDPTQLDYAARVRAAAAPFVEQGVLALTGHRDDVLRIVADADVLVMPSVVDDRGFGLEASPVTAIEAMAVGTPVVAYAAGGLPELLGPCGVLVPLGDRVALADAIAGVLVDEERRLALGRCGQARVAERYTSPHMAEGMRAVYRRVTAQRSRTMGA